jgi:hypothetical protein
MSEVDKGAIIVAIKLVFTDEDGDDEDEAKDDDNLYAVIIDKKWATTEEYTRFLDGKRVFCTEFDYFQTILVGVYGDSSPLKYCYNRCASDLFDMDIWGDCFVFFDLEYGDYNEEQATQIMEDMKLFLIENGVSRNCFMF